MDSSQGRGERSADGAQWSGLEWEKWKTGRNPNRPMTMGRTSDRKPSWGRERGRVIILVGLDTGSLQAGGNVARDAEAEDMLVKLECWICNYRTVDV